MSTDLEDRLRMAGSDLRLDTPLSTILSRGARIRHRRRGVRLGATAAVLAAAGSAISVAQLSGSDNAPIAEDSPSAVPATLTPDQLAAADAICHSMFKGMDPVPADLKPVASGSVLPWSVFLYRYGDEFATCTTVLNDGAPQPSGASTGQSWLPLPQGRHFESFAGSLTTDMSAGDIGAGDAGGKVLDGVSAFLVSDDVARLVLHVGDEDIKATVTNGLALCRLPGGELMSDYEASTITAYDADGHELETLALLDSLPPDGD